MNNPVPQDSAIWMEKGQFHLQRLDYAEALDCLRQALILNPGLSEGWLQYGSVLEKLGCYGAAIAANGNAQKLLTTPTLKLEPPLAEQNAALEAALALQQSSPDYWLKRGHVLCDAGQYEAAIASYDKALALKPDGEAWFGRGNMAAALGQLEDAIFSYDQTAALQPDHYQAWNNRGYVLHKLKQYDAAIDSYDQAIALKADCYPAWNNRGYALYHLGRYEAAIAAFDQAIAFEPNYAEAWNNKANALVALERYSEAVLSYDQAIALKPNFLEAQTGRIQALQHLAPPAIPSEPSVPPVPQSVPPVAEPEPPEPAPASPEIEATLADLSEHLEQAIAHCQQQQFAEAKPLIQQGLEQLEALLQQPNLAPGQKARLASRFSGFAELEVDLCLETHPTQALELSEAVKNRSLMRLQPDWQNTPLPFTQLQSLLSSHTAAICWHLSPIALTTFIVRYGEPPQLLSDPGTSWQTRRDHHQQFMAWMQDWKQAHVPATPSTVSHSVPWQQAMETQVFQKLASLLHIPLLSQTYLRGISHVILIPHRDLHLLPLHALFPEPFVITYLPSVQMGLHLQQRPPKPLQRLVNIGKSAHPDGASEPIPLESALLETLYGNIRSLFIANPDATKTRVMAALNLMSDGLHFAGSVQQSVVDPQQSALGLADSDWLTLTDILDLDLHRYGLVCLSACHFDLTGVETTEDNYALTLTNALLVAGVNHVVSTLWRTDETVRAILMLKFHHFLQHPCSPAIALAKAQKWLRTTPYRVLIPWCQDQVAKLLQHPAGRTGAIALQKQITLLNQRATELGEEACPYAHPFYWAGFILTGQPPDAKPTLKPDTLSLQAFLDAIAHVEEPFNLEFQVELKRINTRLRQLARSHSTLQHQYDAALRKLLKTDLPLPPPES